MSIAAQLRRGMAKSSGASRNPPGEQGVLRRVTRGSPIAQTLIAFTLADTADWPSSMGRTSHAAVPW